MHERWDIVEPEVFVVGARQAGRAARVNRLIHADICLSPAHDSILGGDTKIVQRRLLEREIRSFRSHTRFDIRRLLQRVHDGRRRTGRADWAAIEKLYDALLALTGSPVVAINRAVAVAETRGGGRENQGYNRFSAS